MCNKQKIYFLFVTFVNAMKKILNVLFIILLFSCTPDDKSDNLENDAFDRQAMLVNLTDNIILPSFYDLEGKLRELKNNLDSFSEELDLISLTHLRESFIDAYTSWQHVEMFNIGKAEEIYYPQKMNIYPSNVSRIHLNMTKVDLDLDAGQNEYSAQGFPALDYMLFGLGDNDNEILLTYSNQNNNSLPYLKILVDKMISNTSIVIEDWKINRTEFVNSFGNNSSSSLNMLVNDYVYYYEKGLRTNKFGIPAGRWALKRPQNVEAFYAKNLSKTLAIEALEACDNFFIGKSKISNNIEGHSFKSYLDYLEGQNLLSNSILDAYRVAKTTMMSLEDNFSVIVENDNLKLLEVFQELQEGVVLLKTDMISVMDISVDYMDADGD